MSSVRCHARSSRTGKPCRQWAIRGGTVCITHGGRAPQVKAAAERRLAEEQVRGVLATNGPADPVLDPLTALGQLAGEIVRVKDKFAELVSRLETLRYEGRAGEQIRGELQLYGAWIDRANKILTDMSRLEIDARLAKISEAQTVMLAALVESALADAELALTPIQRLAAPAVIARHIDARITPS